MSELTAADFGDLIAKRIKAEHLSISARWLDRLRGLLQVDANAVFPSEHLLDHIPALIQEVAGYIRAPEAEAIAANTSIIAKAQELGELRHSQQASVHQLLAEYRLLGGILGTFVQEELGRLGLSPAPTDALEVQRRLNDALWILMQTTVDTFVTSYSSMLASHASRLEGFNRMVSHELRQPLGTLMVAVPLLQHEAERRGAEKHRHLIGMIERNVVKLGQLMDQLEALSRLRSDPSDPPEVQKTDVKTVAWEVARQLREMADARGVEIQIVPPLPELVIDMARLELILMNLISNGIKYSDPSKARRVVTIESAAAADPSFACVVVRDNGLGIPEERLSTVFRRFVRAHAERDSELGVRGSGLGLAIAAECAEAVGGSIRVESTLGVGTSFLLHVPHEPLAAAADGDRTAVTTIEDRRSLR